MFENFGYALIGCLLFEFPKVFRMGGAHDFETMQFCLCHCGQQFTLKTSQEFRTITLNVSMLN